MEDSMASFANLLAKTYRMLDMLVDASIVLSYGNTGYKLRHALMWDDTDLDVDLTGKACAITGANSGIGLAASRELARRGATVYLLARNRDRGEAARAQIIAQTGNSNVHLESIDLSSVASVQACADRLKSQTDRLDVLVNNAGNAFEKRELSVDGVE